MNVQGVLQWSWVKCQMKKLMMPPTITLETSWNVLRPWKTRRG